MKISKIFAGMSALAVAATMSLAASADEAPVENQFYNATGTWTYEYTGAEIKKAVEDGGAQLSENGDGTYTWGTNIQVGHQCNAKVTLEVTSTKNNIFNGADADPVNSAYLYTVQPSYNTDAPADKEKHEVKFMADDDGNPVMKKGATDLKDWDSGPTKFNGQWAQFILTDDDLDAVTIKATVVADDATTWEYHPYDDKKSAEENVYIVWRMFGSSAMKEATVPMTELNAQIEGTGDASTDGGESTTDGGDSTTDDGSTDGERTTDDGNTDSDGDGVADSEDDSDGDGVVDSEDDDADGDGETDEDSDSDGGSSNGGSSKSGSSNSGSTGSGSSNSGSSNSGSSNSGSTSGGSSNGGSSNGSGSGTANGTDNSSTGAETMALAGLALAGAAFVVSKKK